MRPDLVVVDSVCLDPGPGVLESQELVLVEALVPELPVEALDVCVLHRLARPDEVELDPVLVGPAVDDAARELGPVVDPDELGPRCSLCSTVAWALGERANSCLYARLQPASDTQQSTEDRDPCLGITIDRLEVLHCASVRIAALLNEDDVVIAVHAHDLVV